ncbi:RNA-binding protein 41 [Synchiropus splendidus]|uniref:RNA-binding protein 41 n=1 Tax=Synchiropus splendidus TaxID=270530 RepID=UPI00237DC6BA|nr:RNA-binding protein 41 [Synchiropus splendidus]
MRRVSRLSCDDGPLLEEQETEGQRQLHNLLVQQLHTGVDIDRCVAKRQCFAPAALYRPFGEQAAGVRSLSQFQALQDGEQELASLRELGLTDSEIQLWQSRNAAEPSEQGHGVCAAPGAKQQRLQVIRDKIDARAELLSRPQRFAASRPLSRREMEIERALFQGSDRQGFLSALYHRDEDADGQQGAPSSDPMDSLYREVLGEEKHRRALEDVRDENTAVSYQSEQPQSSLGDDSQSQCSHDGDSKSQSSHKDEDPLHNSHRADNMDVLGLTGESSSDLQTQTPVQIDILQPIRTLCGMGAGSAGPLTVRGDIQALSDEEILANRDSDEVIRSIPRFRNYQPGKPSKILCVKNLSAQASAAQLVALFSRFEEPAGPPVVYRLLTGRLKGQAFITLQDAETAGRALQLLHGYRLLGKPLVLEFGRERREEDQHK